MKTTFTPARALLLLCLVLLSGNAEACIKVQYALDTGKANGHRQIFIVYYEVAATGEFRTAMVPIPVWEIGGERNVRDYAEKAVRRLEAGKACP